MLTRALRRPTLALAAVVVAGTALYALIFLDPYISLIMLPFFAAGCARGKHPAVLMALAAAPVLLLLAVSQIKFRLTGWPLVTYDHFFLRQNVLMLAYNDWRVALAVAFVLAAILFYLHQLLTGRGSFSRFEKRGVATLGLAALGCVIALGNWDQTITNWQAQFVTPTVRTFVASVRMPKPALHVVSAAQANVPPQSGGMTAPAGDLPDLFFVLQESTFPPALMRPGYAPRSLFGAGNEPGIDGYTGPLHVHTFAGATWKTEFSVTTQMAPQEFGSDGLYVFYQLEGRIKQSIFTRLKALGYRTMVFYPVPGGFINARNFYTSIGVDEFLDPEALGIDTGWEWRTADATFYAAMLKTIAKSDKPVAAMMLTINQHGPHDEADPASDYMARFEASDAAYGDFLKALAARGRKAGVVTFGDHQPEFTAFTDAAGPLYITGYDIRCVHFTCAPSARRGQQIDAVLLASHALEVFGFTLDAFSAFQMSVLGPCADDLTKCGEAARLQINTAFAPFLD